MKKFLAILMALTLMLTVFAGCAKQAAPKADGGDTTKAAETKLSKDQEKIIADLKKELNIEGYEDQVAAELKADPEFTAVAEQAGLDVDEYVGTLAKMYKWDIGDVNVDGDKAVAKVTMTYPDYSVMDQLLDQKLDEYLATNDTSNLTEDEATKIVGQLLMEILKSGELTTTSEDFDIDYIKENGAWKIANYDEVEKAMIDAQSVDDAA